MKYTFYGLILVNIVFFLWESNILGRGSHSDAPYRELQLPRTVEQIVLLRERKDLPEKTLTWIWLRYPRPQRNRSRPKR